MPRRRTLSSATASYCSCWHAARAQRLKMRLEAPHSCHRSNAPAPSRAQASPSRPRGAHTAMALPAPVAPRGASRGAFASRARRCGPRRVAARACAVPPPPPPSRLGVRLPFSELGGCDASFYTARPGDSLRSVAAAHGVSAEELLRNNAHLAGARGAAAELRPGAVVLVAAPSAARPAPVTAATAVAAPLAPAAAQPALPTGCVPPARCRVSVRDADAATGPQRLRRAVCAPGGRGGRSRWRCARAPRSLAAAAAAAAAAAGRRAAAGGTAALAAAATARHRARRGGRGASCRRRCRRLHFFRSRALR